MRISRPWWNWFKTNILRQTFSILCVVPPGSSWSACTISRSHLRETQPRLAQAARGPPLFLWADGCPPLSKTKNIAPKGRRALSKQERERNTCRTCGYLVHVNYLLAKTTLPMLYFPREPVHLTSTLCQESCNGEWTVLAASCAFKHRAKEGRCIGEHWHGDCGHNFCWRRPGEGRTCANAKTILPT